MKRILLLALVLGVVSLLVFKLTNTGPVANVVRPSLKFDQSVSDNEKEKINQALKNSKIKLTTNTLVAIETTTVLPEDGLAVSGYVPVTGLYSARQNINKEELNKSDVKATISKDINKNVIKKIEDTLDLSLEQSTLPVDKNSEVVTFIEADKITPEYKLLSLDGKYYLDDYKNGAVFRQLVVKSGDKKSSKSLAFEQNPSRDNTLRINMTGVTALTRIMMRKLASVGDAGYFSKEIGPFLADADITHVSNEVSFQENCVYHNAVFCSPPEFIKTLTDSGVDVVELTGNHNNDIGRQFNKETINKYHELGIATFGGGLNSVEARKPYEIDKKGSKVALFGYNYADSPSGDPIATSEQAGANSFDYEKIKKDIESAKEKSQFVIVDIQYNECYSYPDGYIEFPECNLPISGQQELFRKVVDLGADMVIGTQAHQPQIYEFYNDKPIYYGLGNMYFDQTQWPGTERGIILTHYFKFGKLIQTKLTPTVYDDRLQTRKMNEPEAEKFLKFLNLSR